MLRDWSDDYLVGIDEIDNQHKGFFEAAHRLHDDILNCEGEESVEQAVQFLRDYAQNHFRTEEKFMQEHGFPGLDKHRQLHVQFFVGLDQLIEDFQVFGPTQHLADQALEIAQDWLIDHIADEDTLYAAYAKKGGA